MEDFRHNDEMSFNIDMNAICVLYRQYQDGRLEPLGTGFFFLENYLVATCRHIMEDHASARVPYDIIVRPSQMGRGWHIKECYYHIEQDLALLKLECSLEVVPLTLCKQTIAGFKMISYDPPAQTVLVRSIPNFFLPDWKEWNTSIERNFEWIGTVNRGNSGSPIIGTDGGVAGILSGVSAIVESTDEGDRKSMRARAVFIGPLMDVYEAIRDDVNKITEVIEPFKGC